jgi:hypothetical protein
MQTGRPARLGPDQLPEGAARARLCRLRRHILTHYFGLRFLVDYYKQLA